MWSSVELSRRIEREQGIALGGVPVGVPHRRGKRLHYPAVRGEVLVDPIGRRIRHLGEAHPAFRFLAVGEDLSGDRAEQKTGSTPTSTNPWNA